jgi:hypothetical protein
LENITVGEIAAFLGILLPILGVLWFMFKIYQKIENNDVLTRANLKATKVMLDHFIEDKIGNGEFKAARDEIDNALIGKTK